MGQRDPLDPDDLLEQARRLASRHNMFFTRQGEAFALFRRTPTRPVFLGRRSTPSALSQLVSRCAACK
ncbi:hypothetical protein [Propionivibrio sp.]|uniref:hypothetical protein n=1 Tax=Propionivibrio sp. TaxID=2212460 RepID=UPI0039E3CDC4